MEDFYIKKIGKRGKINIWLVDGSKIRTNINEEFTNFGHHYTFSFIPENEFWIDKEHSQGEVRYYIDHLLVEHRLMAKGKDKGYAIEQGDKAERRERSKSKLVAKGIRGEIPKEDLIKKVHKKLLKEYSQKINVWLVNGELVRSLFYLDFTEGGHDKVFPFIPENEIWLDDDLDPKEREFILLHELHERNLMPKGHVVEIENGLVKTNKDYTKIYDSAHRSASRLEYYCRHHFEELDKNLKKEIEK